MDITDVSVVVVNWNTIALLHDCLKSIYKQAGHVDFEVIVIDNNSADGSAEMVEKEFSQVTLIKNSENRGFAAANNQGIAVAKGRHVLLLNSDTIILDNAVAKTVSFLDAHPEVAVVGCRVLNPDRTLQPSCFMFPSILNMLLSCSYLYKILPRSRFFGRERMTWWDRHDIREVDVVTGCFMLVRRELIYQVGNMDEQFFMYAEETDWCYRFKQAGWKVIFVPSAEIIHLGGASSKQIKPVMRLQLSGSILLFFRKHKGWAQYVLASLFTALFFLVRLPYWLSMVIISKKNRNTSLKVAFTYILGFFLSLTGWKRLCIHHKSCLL